MWGRDDGPGRTLRTFPVNLMGCVAPMKSLIRAELTRGDTGSLDISRYGRVVGQSGTRVGYFNKVARLVARDQLHNP
jgi:hypothetical protein